MSRFSRLLAPRRIAVIGGGAWCAAIVDAAEALGYHGEIVPVHHTKDSVAGRRAVPRVADIEGPVDAAFIGVNRHATVEIVAALRKAKAGGAICFASGFSEAGDEDASARDLSAALIAAAGEMPILGPNCYGMINALDGVALWPDQHGLRPVPRGVAILTQSSNIALNLTMQSRGLPVAMVVTCGNQAQVSQAELAQALLDDPRITAIGLHIEGFGNLRAWEALATAARARGVALVALKSGRSAQAQAAALSHTASLAGGDVGAEALLARLGIARLGTLPGFLEALKIAHLFGRLPGRAVGSISCSGGEAALAADMAAAAGVALPTLSKSQEAALRESLGPRVALANPLDYHTYIWRDEAAMTAAWAAMAAPGIDLVLVILDYPRPDRCDLQDWAIATRAVIAAARETGARYSVCATLPELLPEDTAAEVLAAGVLPLHGLHSAMEAVAAMGGPGAAPAQPVLLPGPERKAELLDEAEAKATLARHGLDVPRGTRAGRDAAVAVAEGFSGRLAVKVLGLAHKSGAGGLALGVAPCDVEAALASLAPGELLIEEMVTGAVAELLVGVMRDAAHGFVLTLAAGGTETELLADSAHLLLPATRGEIEAALQSLRMAPKLHGYRGRPAAHLPSTLDAIEAIQAYVVDNADTLEEVEVNPLLCTPSAAIAADALIRKARP